MFNQSDWLDNYKTATGIGSDYSLAKTLAIPANYVPQLRTGRLRLRLATILQIAEKLQVEPLEIIVSLEFPRCREHERARLIDWYFGEAIKTIGARMSTQCISSYHPRRRVWR